MKRLADNGGDFIAPNEEPTPVCPVHGSVKDMAPEERLLHAIFGKCDPTAPVPVAAPDEENV